MYRVQQVPVKRNQYFPKTSIPPDTNTSISHRLTKLIQLDLLCAKHHKNLGI